MNIYPVIENSVLNFDNLRKIYNAFGKFFGNENIQSFEELVDLMEISADRDFDDYLLKMKAVSKSIYVKNILGVEKLNELAKRYGIMEPVEFSCPVLHVAGKKLSKGNEGVPVHQDWPSTRGSLNSIIIWISLGGADTGTGGLNFYCSPNNSRYLFDAEIAQHVVKITDPKLNSLDKKYLSINAGNAIIFDHFLPHDSQNGNARLSISVRVEDASEEEWKKRKYEYAHTTIISRRDVINDVS